MTHPNLPEAVPIQRQRNDASGTFLAGIAIVLLLLFGASTVQAQVAPRARVDAVAQAIQENYFDARRGRRIAADLRAAAAQGEFDTLTDPHDLATALTDRLRPLDGHFRVRESSQVNEPGAAVPMGAPSQPDEEAHGDDYGIRRTEVMSGNIGYISLGEFAHFEFGSSNQPARQAIESALQQVADTEALIIDLRDNRGGSPSMVGYLTSAFTPPGADIYNTFHSRSGATQSEAPLDWYPTPRLDVPIYVLIDARTASAAEAFAYTMKNAQRATIVGESSRGAANPGGEVDAGADLLVFVPDGSPVSPVTGTNWEGTGVVPDVAASSQSALDVALDLARDMDFRTM